MYRKVSNKHIKTKAYYTVIFNIWTQLKFYFVAHCVNKKALVQMFFIQYITFIFSEIIMDHLTLSHKI